MQKLTAGNIVINVALRKHIWHIDYNDCTDVGNSYQRQKSTATMIRNAKLKTYYFTLIICRKQYLKKLFYAHEDAFLNLFW